AEPDRRLEDLLGQLADARQRRAAAREHDAARNAVLEVRLGQLAARQRQDLLDARLDDLAQQLARHLARSPTADARHGQDVVAAEQPRRGDTELLLDALGLVERRAQADGDVVRDVVA